MVMYEQHSYIHGYHLCNAIAMCYIEVASQVIGEKRKENHYILATNTCCKR